MMLEYIAQVPFYLSPILLCICAPILYFVISPRVIKKLFVASIENGVHHQFNRSHATNADQELSMYGAEKRPMNNLSQLPLEPNLHDSLHVKFQSNVPDQCFQLRSGGVDKTIHESLSIGIPSRVHEPQCPTSNKLPSIHLPIQSIPIATFSKHFFSLAFTLSTISFLFLVIDLVVGGDTKLRLNIWKLLMFFTTTYIGIGPIVLLWNLIQKGNPFVRSQRASLRSRNNGIASKSLHTILTIFFYITFLWLFVQFTNVLFWLWRADFDIGQSVGEYASHNIIIQWIYTLRNDLFERVVLFGFVLVGIFSGYGSTQIPIKYVFSRIFQLQKEDIDPDQIENMTIKYDRTNKVLQEKYAQLDAFIRSNAQENQSPSRFTRITSLLPILTNEQSYDTQLEEKRLEIESLENLQQELQFELQYLQEQRNQLEMQKKVKGKLLFLAGIIFSFWCLLRIAMSTMNIVTNRRKILDRDPIISRILQYITLRTGFNLVVFHQQATLLILFLIVILSIRRLLLNIHRIFRRIVLQSLSMNLMIQFFSIIMPIYTLSSIMLFRLHLPVSNREILSTVLSSHHEQLFYFVFDWIFVLSCLSSFFLMIISQKLNQIWMSNGKFASHNI